MVNIGIGLATPDAHVPFDIVYGLVAFCVYLVAMEITLEVVDRVGKDKSGKTMSKLKHNATIKLQYFRKYPKKMKCELYLER